MEASLLIWATDQIVSLKGRYPLVVHELGLGTRCDKDQALTLSSREPLSMWEGMTKLVKARPQGQQASR